MACDTYIPTGQTLAERKAALAKAAQELDRKIAAGLVRVRIDRNTGAVAFEGFVSSAPGMTDACAYRRIMVTGSALTKAAIARAELLAGRSISRQAIAAGVHSHDGGKTWHNGH